MKLEDFQSKMDAVSAKAKACRTGRDEVMSFVHTIINNVIFHLPAGMDLPREYMVMEEYDYQGNARKFIVKLIVINEMRVGYRVVGGCQGKMCDYTASMSFVEDLHEGWLDEVGELLDKHIVSHAHYSDQLSGAVIAPESETIQSLNAMLGSEVLSLAD